MKGIETASWACSLFFGLGVILAGELEPSVAKWILLQNRYLDAPRGADGIAIFGGGGGYRINKGIELLRDGYSENILFLGNATEFSTLRSLAEERGVSAARFILPSRLPQNTHSGVQALRDVVAQKNWQRILLVSDHPHLLRIRLSLMDGSDVFREYLSISSNRPVPIRTFSDRMQVYREFLKCFLVWTFGDSADDGDLARRWPHLGGKGTEGKVLVERLPKGEL